MRHRTMLQSTLLVLLVIVTTMWVSIPAGAKGAASTQQFASHPGTSKSYRPSGSGHGSPSHTVNLATTPQVHGHVYPVPGHRYGPAPKTQISTPNRGATVLPVPTKPANVSANTPYPLIGSSFTGIGDTGVAPSDSMNAVSATNVVETVNERFSVYSRSGTALYSTDLQTFFAGVGNFDPRVAYDTWGNRFVIVTDTGSSFLLAVSSDATGLNTWCQYTFATLPGFLDYPMIGMDSKNIYFAANDDGDNNNEIFEVNRASVENACGGSPTWTDWANVPDAEGVAGFLFINPIVETARDGARPEYMISSHWWGDCSLTLWTINGTTLTTTLVPTGCYTAASSSDNPEQVNTTATLDSGGSRIIGASYINGVISTGLTTDYDWGSGNHKTALYWWQILPNGTVAREKIVGNPTWWYYYPNFQQDENGDTLLVLNSSTTYSYVNIWFYVFDPSGNEVGNNGIQWGTGPYGSSGTTARWGDLNSIMIDPTGPGNDVWICGQYATSTGQWGTWNAQITA